jgi:hypothetical protein
MPLANFSRLHHLPCSVQENFNLTQAGPWVAARRSAAGHWSAAARPLPPPVHTCRPSPARHLPRTPRASTRTPLRQGRARSHPPTVSLPLCAVLQRRLGAFVAA